MEWLSYHYRVIKGKFCKYILGQSYTEQVSKRMIKAIDRGVKIDRGGNY
jgi:hypothetical protein